MKVSEGRLRARDGTPIGYTLHGSPAASRFTVLVHSLAMDRHFWDPVALRLAAGAAVLVAGASMGGCIALAFSGRYAKRVASLGLIDTTAWYGPEAPRQWEERAQQALERGLAGLVDFQVTRWFSDEFRAARPEVVSASVAAFLRNDPQAYAASCRMLGAADLRAALPGIRVPTAIVVGEQDYATPVGMAEALHSNIKGSTLTVLKNARHLTPLEKPDEIAAELEKLLK